MSSDNYFNLQLNEAEEIVEGKNKGKVGEIFIRCNNVLWIGEDPSAQENEQQDKPPSDNAPTTATD